MKFAEVQMLREAGLTTNEQEQRNVDHFKLPEDRSRVLIILAASICLFGTIARIGLGFAAEPQPPPKPQALRIVVLPFQNATGEAALDDWRQALPALVRSCLDRAEFTRIPRWKTIQPALVRAGWTTTTTIDAKLARQMAQELKADVAVWGSFRHLTNGWAVDAKVLRANSEAAPVELHFTSLRWVDLAESVALGLAKELDRPIAADDRQLWRMHLPDSEKAAACLAKAITLEAQEAPAADQEQACARGAGRGSTLRSCPSLPLQHPRRSQTKGRAGRSGPGVCPTAASIVQRAFCAGPAAWREP